MNKTLITGCAGFIGGHLANRSLEEGNETWGIDNLSRPGDQKVYFSDISKVSRSINWSPKTTPMQGLEKLVMWAKSNLDLIRQTLVF